MRADGANAAAADAGGWFPPPEAFIDGLRRVVGPAHVITNPDLRATYEIDWTRRFQGRAGAVVRPGDTNEVASVMRLCSEFDQPVVPQGGNTGLVGGGVPRSGEVVLSLRRLDWIDAVDVHAGQISAGAGASLAKLQSEAAAAGYALGIDFAARDSATVGGIVATNAGGERVQRYGMTRSQTVGIELVLSDGTTIQRMGGLVKDNCGYDLAGLVSGSEGTLAVITAARFQLFPALPHRTVALLGLPSTETALTALRHLRTRLDGIEAADIFFDEGLQLVCDHASLRRPFRTSPDTYLIVEVAARKDVEGAIASALQELGDIEAAIASDGASRRALWRYREAHTETIASHGIPLKLDVAAPPRIFPELVAAVRLAVQRLSSTSQVILFGHLAEGNLHVNILGGDESTHHIVSDAVLNEVALRSGSVGAEHGVGVAKAGWLGLSRSPDDVALMRSVKRAMDPKGLLNPGVLFATGHDKLRG